MDYEKREKFFLLKDENAYPSCKIHDVERSILVIQNVT